MLSPRGSGGAARDATRGSDVEREVGGGRAAREGAGALLEDGGAGDRAGRRREERPDDRGRPVGARRATSAASPLAWAVAAELPLKTPQVRPVDSGRAPSTASPSATASGLTDVPRGSPAALHRAVRRVPGSPATRETVTRVPGWRDTQRLNVRPADADRWTVGTEWRSAVTEPGRRLTSTMARPPACATDSDLSMRPMRAALADHDPVGDQARVEGPEPALRGRASRRPGCGRVLGQHGATSHRGGTAAAVPRPAAGQPTRPRDIRPTAAPTVVTHGAAWAA